MFRSGVDGSAFGDWGACEAGGTLELSNRAVVLVVKGQTSCLRHSLAPRTANPEPSTPDRNTEPTPTHANRRHPTHMVFSLTGAPTNFTHSHPIDASSDR